MTTSVAANPAFSLCVYCGSRLGQQALYADLARALGQKIGSSGGQLVYGGGRQGLMGVLADATLAAGGRVVGIIPHALVEREWAHTACTELLVVDSMHQRKRLMAERADAFLALPGGIGTLEELFEVWSWRQLGYHDKPLGLLNADGYYNGLLAFMQHTLDQQFVGDWQMQLIQVESSLDTLLAKLLPARPGAAQPQWDQI